MNQRLHKETNQPLQLVKRATERLDEIAEVVRDCEAQMRTAAQLKAVSAFGYGNSLAAVIYPASIISAARLVHRLTQLGIRWRVLGGGESVLAAAMQGIGNVSGNGLSKANVPAAGMLQDFVAISLRLLDEGLIFDGERVRVHAGYSIAALVQAAAERGLSGLEGLAGITGSLGSALRNGNGLVGRYVWSVVEEVVIAERGGLSIMNLTDPAERELFDPQDLILAVTLKLTPRAAEIVQAETERAWHSRWAATPYSRLPQARNVDLRVVSNAASGRPPATTTDGALSVSREQVPLFPQEMNALRAEAELRAQQAASRKPDDELFGLSALIRERVQRELQKQLATIPLAQVLARSNPET